MHERSVRHEIGMGDFISKDHYTAVISPTYFDDVFTFLLAGWDDNVPKPAKSTEASEACTLI